MKVIAQFNGPVAQVKVADMAGGDFPFAVYVLKPGKPKYEKADAFVDQHYALKKAVEMFAFANNL